MPVFAPLRILQSVYLPCRPLYLSFSCFFHLFLREIISTAFLPLKSARTPSKNVKLSSEGADSLYQQEKLCSLRKEFYKEESDMKKVLSIVLSLAMVVCMMPLAYLQHRLKMQLILTSPARNVRAL